MENNTLLDVKNLTIHYITKDGVVRAVNDLSLKLEKGELYKNPRHPYTVGLFNSLPDIQKDEDNLKPIKGLMPDPTDLPPGCAFHPRCDKARPECSKTEPQNAEASANHIVKCLLCNK